MDTGGDFVWAVRGAGLPFAKSPILTRFGLIGSRREFATSRLCR